MEDFSSTTFKNFEDVPSNWFRHVVDSMLEGFQVIDNNWKYLYVNKTVIRQSKFSKDELLGFTMMEKYPGIENTAMFRSLQKCMYERVPLQLENEFHFPDGSKGWFVLSIEPINEGIIILSVDVTERKKIQENLMRSFELISAQKKQLEEFCNVISHDLRAPLTNILMLTDYIEQSINTTVQNDYINKLKTAANFLNDTFNELVESLQFQQDSNIEWETVILEESFQNILNGMSGEITKTNASIKTDFADAPTLYFPSKYITSILQNLVSNSLKYHHPNRPPNVVVNSRRSNGKIIISVSDNGLGIDLAKHRKSLFRIRKTFHSHPNARGIGLFITKQQIESMGGKIWVESHPGEGSTFYVEFLNQKK